MPVLGCVTLDITAPLVSIQTAVLPSVTPACSRCPPPRLADSLFVCGFMTLLDTAIAQLKASLIAQGGGVLGVGGGGHPYVV